MITVVTLIFHACTLKDSQETQARSSTATESSVLGPFHIEDTRLFENGQSIGSHGVSGEPMLIHATVRATDGTLVEGATVDIWETNGNYDMQDPNRDGPDCQGIFHTDRNGR